MFNEICKSDPDTEDTKFGKDIRGYLEENEKICDEAMKKWDKV